MSKIKDRKRDKQDILKQVLQAGCKPAKGAMFCCGFHNDNTASAWIKLSASGYYYFRCFTCNITYDVFDLEAKNTGKDVREILKEWGEVENKQYYYESAEEMADSLNASLVQEINNYTNPETGNVDLVTIRYISRDSGKKSFCQGYQTEKGFIRKRPAGLLPLFNRKRLLESDTVIFVEGEKCVRTLTQLGFTATTGSGGSSNASAHDYSTLAGKIVFCWPDFHETGQKYILAVRDKLLELDPPATVYLIDPTNLDLPEGGDVADLVERVKAEGGNLEDCKIEVELVLAESDESNRLQSFEDMLDGMREGTIKNLPIKGFPLLTNEAMTLLNQQVSVLYGAAGFGKTLFAGKMCDDLKLQGYEVARLQLEDDLSKHLLRTLAQQLKRSELTKPYFHQSNPEESKHLYEQNKEMLDTISTTIMADEMIDWSVESILVWVEQQLKAGKELIVIDPASVVMTDKIWIASHRLMWGIKRLLKQYPNSRVVLVTHPNSEGDVSGGQAFKRFCNNLLVLNKYKAPKMVSVINSNGAEETLEVNMSIGIVKTRDGSGSGNEIAIRLNPATLCLEEVGIIIREIKETTPRTPSGRNLEKENANYTGIL